jgi:hypothetical protein
VLRTVEVMHSGFKHRILWAYGSFCALTNARYTSCVTGRLHLSQQVINLFPDCYIPREENLWVCEAVWSVLYDLSWKQEGISKRVKATLAARRYSPAEDVAIFHGKELREV